MSNASNMTLWDKEEERSTRLSKNTKPFNLPSLPAAFIAPFRPVDDDIRKQQSTHFYFRENNYVERKFQHSSEREIETEKIIQEILYQKAFILADGIGTGKTTTLKNLSEIIRDNFHIMVKFIEVRKTIENFENFKGNVYHEEDLKFFYSELLSISPDIIQIQFNSNNNFIIFWDGFDEISEKYQQFLLKVMRQTTIFMPIDQVISCRLHSKEILEKAFNVKAYNLEPFKIEEIPKVIECFMENCSHQDQRKLSNEIDCNRAIKFLSMITNNDQHPMTSKSLENSSECAESSQSSDLRKSLKIVKKLEKISKTTIDNPLIIEAICNLPEKDDSNLTQIITGIMKQLMVTELKKNDDYLNKHCDIFINSQESVSQIHQFHALQDYFVLNYFDGNKNASSFGLLNMNSDGSFSFLSKIFADFFIAQFIKNGVYKQNVEHLEDLIVKVKTNELITLLVTEMQSNHHNLLKKYFLKVELNSLQEEVVTNLDEILPKSIKREKNVSKSSAQGYYDTDLRKFSQPMNKFEIKSSKKIFSDLTQEEKDKIFASKVTFQGCEVNFGSLVYQSEELCNHLSAEDIDKFLKGKPVSFFKPLKRPSENYKERNFKKNKSDEDDDDDDDHENVVVGDDYDDYLKRNVNRRRDDDDDDYRERKSGNGNFRQENYKIRQHGKNSSKSSSTNQNFNSQQPSKSNCSSSSNSYNNHSSSNNGDDDKNNNNNNRRNGMIKNQSEIQDDYELNKVLTMEDLEALAELQKFILIADVPGSGKSATLLNVYYKYKQKFEREALGIIPFVFHINFSDKSMLKSYNRRLFDIIDSKNRDIIWRLTKLDPDFDCKYKFTNELFRAKFERGHVIFLWDDIEVVGDEFNIDESAKRKCLLDMIKEIKDKEHKRNQQWTVTDKLHRKKREIFFNCVSYKFLRISDENQLLEFYKKLNINQDEAESINENIMIKFQKFVEEKNEFSSTRSFINFTEKMLKFGNVYQAFEEMYNELKLSEESITAFRYFVIRDAIRTFKSGEIFNELDVMQETEDSLQTEQLVELGLLRKFNTINDCEIARDFEMFVMAKYFVRNILSLKKVRAKDKSEIELRVKFLFKVMNCEKFCYARKILIEYLLLKVKNDFIHEIFEEILSENFVEFLNLPDSSKIFFLHFFKGNENIYKKLKVRFRGLAAKLESFLANESLKLQVENNEENL